MRACLDECTELVVVGVEGRGGVHLHHPRRLRGRIPEGVPHPTRLRHITTRTDGADRVTDQVLQLAVEDETALVLTRVGVRMDQRPRWDDALHDEEAPRQTLAVDLV